jgi:hypothetical protein
MLIAVELVSAISVLSVKVWPFCPCQTVIVDVVVPASLLVNVLEAVTLTLKFTAVNGTYFS